MSSNVSQVYDISSKSSCGAKNGAVSSGRVKVPRRIDSGSSTIFLGFDLVLGLEVPDKPA